MHMYDFISSDVIWNKDSDRARVNKSALLSSDNPLELDEFAAQANQISERFIEGLTTKWSICGVTGNINENRDR